MQKYSRSQEKKKEQTILQEHIYYLVEASYDDYIVEALSSDKIWDKLPIGECSCVACLNIRSMKERLNS